MTVFTGIIEEVGQIVALELHGYQVASGESDVPMDAVITVRGPLAVSDAAVGDSIAVNGVCLTVTELGADTFSADVMPETLRHTSLGALRVGGAVNLERALPAGGRLGGHIVQGHVDAVAQVLARRPGERWDEFDLSLPAELAKFVALKGSITLDGVSLTVSRVTDDSFGVSLIPTTLTATTLGKRKAGDVVNVEVDVLAKYVARLWEQEK